MAPVARRQPIHLTVKEMLSSWKSIAVILDDTPKGENIGKTAAALAYLCGKHLIGIHGMSCNPAEHPSDSFACGKKAIHSSVSGAGSENPDRGLTSAACSG